MLVEGWGRGVWEHFFLRSRSQRTQSNSPRSGTEREARAVAVTAAAGRGHGGRGRDVAGRAAEERSEAPVQGGLSLSCVVSVLHGHWPSR